METNENFNFEKLLVYQNSLAFADKVYEKTKSFPLEEKYGLVDQFRRASLSIALNIAEGHGQTPMQFKRYLNIARGSIRECVAIIEPALNRNYLRSPEREELRAPCVELSRMISGLIKNMHK